MVDIVTPDRVGYSPVPNARPELTPTRPIFLNTPPAAFGEERAKALGLLGKTLDTASDELGTRALAMQSLNNQAMARQAASNTVDKATQLWQDFRSKQGQDAGPEAFTKYQQDLKGIMEGGGQGMNPMAAEMYAQYTWSDRQRLDTWGATHSGEQLDNFQKATRLAQIDSAGNLAASNPTDEGAFKRALGVADDAIDSMGKRAGLTDDILGPQKAEQHAKIALNSLKELADVDANRARAQIDKPLYKEALGPRYGDALKYIQAQQDQFSSHNITNGIFDGSSMQLGAGKVPIERAEYAMGMKEGSGSWDPPHQPTKDGDLALGRFGVMRSNLQSFLQQSGLPSMTPAQFIADHDAQTRVFDTVFGGYMQKTGNFNDAASMWFTGKTMKDAGATVNDGHTTNAAYITDVNKFLADKTPLGEMQAAAEAHAEKLSPGNDLLKDRVRAGVDTHQNQIDMAQRLQTLQDKTTVDDAIQNWNGQGLLSVQTLIKANPQFAEIYRNAPEAEQIKIDGQITKAVKQDNVPSDERSANHNTMLGAAYGNDPTFASKDLYSVDLTQQDRTALIGLQKQVAQGKVLQDPDIAAAQKDYDIRNKLSDYGITNDTAGRREWNQFWGAFQDEASVARGQGKALSPEDLNTIANGLLQQHNKGWFSSGPYDYETFKSIPDTERKKAIDVLNQQGVVNPTDHEIEMLYAKAMYNATMNAKSDATK